jgi:hypothetical protein
MRDFAATTLFVFVLRCSSGGTHGIELGAAQEHE